MSKNLIRYKWSKGSERQEFQRLYEGLVLEKCQYFQDLASLWTCMDKITRKTPQALSNSSCFCMKQQSPTKNTLNNFDTLPFKLLKNCFVSMSELGYLLQSDELNKRDFSPPSSIRNILDTMLQKIMKPYYVTFLLISYVFL